MLDTLVRAVEVVADRGPDPGQLARSDRRAHAGAADEHAPFGATRDDLVADLLGLVGVVDADLGRVRAEVDHVVASERLGDRLAERHSAMVECNGHPHTWIMPAGSRST